jgi:hypothetical protein
VRALYKRRSAANSLLFLEKGYRGISLSDPTNTNHRGREFFAYAFQEKPIEYGIKFRPLIGDSAPIPPRFFALRQDVGLRKSIQFPPYPGPKIGARVASPQSSIFRFGMA